VLKVLVPGIVVLAVVWAVDIPKEWLPGKSERQIWAEQEKAAADEVEAARRHAEANAVRRFTDPEGFYTAEFRGKPELRTINSNEMFQWMATAGYAHHITHDGIRFETKYERWDVLGKTADEKLRKMTPKLLTGPGMPAPTVKRLTTASGIEGIAAAGVYEDRPRRFKMLRRYLVPEQDDCDRYYTAVVTGPADWLPNPEAEAFLASFELTEKALLYPLPGAPRDRRRSGPNPQ
jgi:hypothetical protein